MTRYIGRLRLGKGAVIFKISTYARSLYKLFRIDTLSEGCNDDLKRAITILSYVEHCPTNQGSNPNGFVFFLKYNL